LKELERQYKVLNESPRVPRRVPCVSHATMA
jgi:hypothetical protein